MPLHELLDIRLLCNLSGLMTLSRLPLALLFPFVAANPIYASIVIVLAAILDALDGVVARRCGTDSYLGGFADGWIDKIFSINAGWSLVVFDWMSWWSVCLLFTREWVQIPMVPYYVTRYVRGKKPPNQPLITGKACSVLLVFAMLSALWTMDVLMWMCIIGTSVLGVYTTYVYLRREFEQNQEINYKS